MSALAPLHYAPFRFLVVGRVVTMLGNAVAPIALAFAVLDLTGSVSDLGLVVAARSVTNVVFLLFGGVVADRLPRQLVLVGASTLAALSQGVVAAVVLTGSASVPLLAVLGTVNGFAAAFAFPASSAIVAQTVPEGIRRQANAINRLGSNAALIVGAAGGAAVIAVVGPGWGIAADAATFAVAAVAFALVRVPAVRAASVGPTNAFAELREGWREFVSRSWVWVIVLGFCFVNAALVGAMQVLGPAVADDTFGRRAWGVVLAAETAGMVLGGLLALRLKARRLLLIGTACVGALVPLIVALAVAPVVPLLVACAVVAGVAIEQFGVAWETSLQEHVPAERLARVYSYDALGSFIAIPLGEVAVGPIAHGVGTEATLLGAAGVIAVATVGMLADRSVRTLRHGSVASSPVDPVPEAAAV